MFDDPPPIVCGSSLPPPPEMANLAALLFECSSASLVRLISFSLFFLSGFVLFCFVLFCCCCFFGNNFYCWWHCFADSWGNIVQVWMHKIMNSYSSCNISGASLPMLLKSVCAVNCIKEFYLNIVKNIFQSTRRGIRTTAVTRLRTIFVLFSEERGYNQGWYVIVAVDYWGRRSPTSQPATISNTGWYILYKQSTH